MDMKGYRSILAKYAPYFVFLALLLFEFWAVLSHPQPLWDDFHFLFNSPRFTNAESFLDFFSLGARQQDRRAWPMTYTVLWLMYKAFGTKYLYYKILSLLVHWINGCLLFRLLRGFNANLAFVFTLIFLLNPMQIETVAWILQFGSLASTTFLLLSLFAFERFVDEDFKLGRPFYLSVAAFLVSILFKASGILFPFFGLVYIFMLDRKKLVNRNFVLWFCIVASCSLWRGLHTLIGSTATPIETAISETYQKQNLSYGNMMTAAVVPSVKIVQPKNAPEVRAEPISAVIAESPAEATVSEPIEDTRFQDFWNGLLEKAKGLGEKLNISVGSFVAYFGIFFGLKQNLFFYPKALFDHTAYIISSYAIVLAMFVLMIVKVRNKFVIQAAVMGFLVFIPISGMFYVPYMKYSFIADHWFYPASFFLCVVLFHLVGRWQGRVQQVGLVVLMLLCLKQVYDAKVYASYFSDQKVLLSHNLEHNEELELLRMMLAEELVKEMKYQEAHAVLAKAPMPVSFDLENMKLYLLLKFDDGARTADLLVDLIRRSRNEGQDELGANYLKILLQKYPTHPAVQDLLDGMFDGP